MTRFATALSAVLVAVVLALTGVAEAVNVGDRVAVAAPNPHNVRTAPNSTLAYTSVPTGTPGIVTGGPSADQSGGTAIYMRVLWDNQTYNLGDNVNGSWMVQDWLVKTTGSLSGQVTNAAGDGIAANVNIPGQTITTPDGNYFFQNVTPGSVSVVASASGFVTQTVSVSVTAAATSTQNFTLAVAPGTISGTIQTPTGAALAGATVSVPGTSTTSAADGSYTLTPMSPGTYTVTASKAGYVSQDQSATVSAGVNTDLDFTLQVATGSISGVVTSSGSPVAGVGVSVPGIQTFSAADGTYTLANVPVGTYAVTAGAMGYVTNQQSGIVVSQGVTTTLNFSMVVAPGTISGTVKDGSGAAISGATVSVPGFSTSSAANGQYTLVNLPAGSYTVTASKSGLTSQSLPATVSAGQTVTLNFTLTTPPTTGTISGVVRDPAGVAVSDAMVIIVGGPDPDNLPAPVTTATNGAYSFMNLSPGTYVVSANKDNFIILNHDVVVTVGQGAVLDITLQPIPPGGSSGLTATEKASLMNLIESGFSGKPGDAGSLSDMLSAQVDLILRTSTNGSTRAALQTLKAKIRIARQHTASAMMDLLGAVPKGETNPRSFYVNRALSTIATLKSTDYPAVLSAANAAKAAGAVGTYPATMDRAISIGYNGALAKLNAVCTSCTYVNPYPLGRSADGSRITIVGPHGDYLDAMQHLQVAFSRMDSMEDNFIVAYGADSLLPGYENTYQRFKFVDLVERKLGNYSGAMVGMVFSGFPSDQFFNMLAMLELATHGGGGPTTPDNDCSPDRCHGFSYDFNNLQIWITGDSGQWGSRPTFGSKMLDGFRLLTEAWQETDTLVWYTLKFPQCEVTGGCGGI